MFEDYESILDVSTGYVDVMHQHKEETPVVRGICGIMELFHVGRITAREYAKTWLKPAIMSRGKEMVVSVYKALSLFEEKI